MKNFSLIVFIGLILLIFFSSCEKDVYTGLDEVEVPPVYTKMVFTSNPSGASIYLDGKNMGIVTPDSIQWIDPGIHKVVYKKDLFLDVPINAEAVADQRKVYSVDYYKMPSQYGMLECLSTPDKSSLFLNKVATGLKTPATFSNLFPGKYEVKFVYPFCRADSVSILVRAGDKSTISVLLEDTTKWVSYTVYNSRLISNAITCMCVDQNNVKWIGNEKGLIRFDGKNFQYFTSQNSILSVDYISSVAVDKNNKLWVGTFGGLYAFDGTVWNDYSGKLLNNTVNVIKCDSKGNTWIGTRGGLVKYNGSSWTTYTMSNSGILGNVVTAIGIPPEEDKIWIGTNAFGISVFSGSNWSAWTMTNMGVKSTIGNWIKDLEIDKKGVVWVTHLQDAKLGLAGGITSYNGTSWSAITLKDIPSETIDKIYVDQNNIKWMGSQLGVIFFTDPKTSNYFSIRNLPALTTAVKAISVDKNGDLFLGTFNSGFIKVKKGNF